jgi:hypothetical protein
MAVGFTKCKDRLQIIIFCPWYLVEKNKGGYLKNKNEHYVFQT